MNKLDEMDYYNPQAKEVNDNAIPVDRYIRQQNFKDVHSTDDLECHVTTYDEPQIDTYEESTNTRHDIDNGHLVFDLNK
jgi:hypothetical protein